LRGRRRRCGPCSPCCMSRASWTSPRRRSMPRCSTPGNTSAPNARCIVMRLLLLGLGIAAACLAAGAGDVDRMQGVITELHPQGFILATEGRTVVVDMSALGVITMALAAPMVYTVANVTVNDPFYSSNVVCPEW